MRSEKKPKKSNPKTARKPKQAPNPDFAQIVSQMKEQHSEIMDKLGSLGWKLNELTDKATTLREQMNGLYAYFNGKEAAQRQSAAPRP